MAASLSQDRSTIITRTSARRRFITVRSERGHDEIDLELPGDRPIGALLTDLIKTLNWQLTEGGQPLHYGLRTEAGSLLDDRNTLTEAGIENSDTLWVVLVDQLAVMPTPVPGTTIEQVAGEGMVSGFAGVPDIEASPQARRGTLIPPRPAQMEITEPCLVSETAGLILELGPLPVSIGRPGRGRRPDIDLTELDTEFLSTRWVHAYIEREDGQFVLRTVKTLNGTFVNSEQIPPGRTRPISDGDRIQFGFRGVELIFRLPPT